MSEFKRYPKYKESGIEWLGEVPEHWGISKLKWVSNFIYGDSLSNENRMEGAIPVYGSNGITGYHNKAITNKPCIIIGRKGSFGKINFSDIECFPIDTTYYIDNTATKHNLYWLRYVLDILRLDEYTKDAAVPGLAREEAYHKLISVPSIEEQRLIAESIIYKTIQIDTLIEKKQKLIELLKEYRTAIINQAVTKGLNPDVPMKDSGIEWLGEVPVHWEVKKLKHIANIINGSTPDSGRSEYWDGNINWLTPVDLSSLDKPYIYTSERKITELGLNSCGTKLIPVNTIIISTRAPIGHIGIAKIIACTNQGCKSVLLREDNYLYYYYLLFSMKEILQAFGSGTTFKELSSNTLKHILMLKPSLSEQRNIALYLDTKTFQIDTLIEKKQKLIELLKEYRTTLISDVVTGKIDVRGEV